MREMCLRTSLMATMSAPEARSTRFVSALSASEMPSAGDDREGRAAAGDQREEQVVRPGLGGDLEQAQTAAQTALVGHRVRGLEHLDVPQRSAPARA